MTTRSPAESHLIGRTPPVARGLLTLGILVAGLLALNAKTEAAIQFDSLAAYPISPKSNRVLMADLNGDGHPDALMARAVTVVVSPVKSMVQYSTEWLAGDGMGGFGAASTVPQSLNLDLVAAGDINGDEVVDLVLRCDSNPDDTNNGTLSWVAVLLGHGDGTFDSRRVSPVGTTFTNAFLSNVNADGIVDVLVITTGLSSAGRVLPGVGDGSFGSGVSFSADISGVYGIGDVDSDGDIDVVVSKGATVQVLAGNGDGTFLKKPTHTPAGNFTGLARSLAVADANGDGVLDLIQVGDFNSLYNLRVAWGLGDGTFAENAQYTVGDDPRELATGDFNSDGWADVATLNRTSRTISILPGASSGAFGPRLDLALRSDLVSFATGDVDGDHSLDFVVSESDLDSISVFRNQICGATPVEWHSVVHQHGDLLVTWAPVGFPGMPEVQRRSSPSSDWESLGPPLQDSQGRWRYYDTVVQPQVETSYRLAFDLNGCPSTTGEIAAVVTPTPRADFHAGGTPRDVQVADFDGDGRPDVVAATEEGSISVLLSTAGDWGETVRCVPGGRPRALTSGDFNSDGHLDLAVALYDRRQVAILGGRGDGTFTISQRFATGGEPTAIVTADFDLDGVLDVATANFNSYGFSVMRGRGDGTFFPATTTPLPSVGVGIGVTDLDEDGRPDLVVLFNGGLNSYLGRPGGTFVAGPSRNLAAQDIVALRVAKLDPSGLDQFIVIQYGHVDTYALESGTFVQKNHQTLNLPQPYPTSVGIAVGDVDSNGLLDVAVMSPGTRRVSILLGMEPGRLSQPVTYDGPSSQAVAIGDMNGDASPDLVIGNLDQTISIIDNAHHPTTAVVGSPSRMDFGIIRLSPNPAREHIEVVFDLNSRASAELGLWDISGRRVVQRTVPGTVGRQAIQIDNLGLRPGVYYAVVQQGLQRSGRRLVILR